MDFLNKKQHVIDYLGLISIGVVSLGYVLYGKLFAEVHIQFPFLDFPIFIGEMLLFLCFILLFAKIFMQSKMDFKLRVQMINKWGILVGCYFVFVVGKALYGYIYKAWGPLAFRHAALLYYPMFAFFGFLFYRKGFLDIRKQFLFSLIIVCIFAFCEFYDYWTISLFILAFVLIKSIRYKIPMFLMMLLLLITTPYETIFYTSRMMLVGNFIVGIYLVIALYVALPLSRKLKWILIGLSIFLVLCGVKKFGDQAAIKSIVSLGKMTEMFRLHDQEIQAHKSDFKRRDLKKVQVHHPNNAITQGPEATPFWKVKKEIQAIFIDRISEGTDEVFQQNIEGLGNEESILRLKSKLRDDAAREIKRKIQEISVHEIYNELQKNPIIGLKDKEVVLLIEIVKKEFLEILDKQVEENAKAGFLVQKVSNAESLVSETLLNNPVEKNAKVEIPRQKGTVKRALVTEMLLAMENRLIEEVKNEIKEDLITKTLQTKAAKNRAKKYRSMDAATVNAVFRLFIWRDMIVELMEEKPILGFDFGKPLRSISLEVLNWGVVDWLRDGWIGAHNSYLHIIYRTGIIGVLFIVFILSTLYKMIRELLQLKFITGILLCAIIINWFVAANFLLIFELPYTAIPIWSLYGVILAYYCNKTGKLSGQDFFIKN